MNDSEKMDFNVLSERAFRIISLIEASNIEERSFRLIRKRLLDLGNDIHRLGCEMELVDGDKDAY